MSFLQICVFSYLVSTATAARSSKTLQQDDVLEQAIVDDTGLEIYRESRQAAKELRDHTHIERLDVKCSKAGFEVTIEFETTFSGVIYSKGHFDNSRCR